MFNILNIWKYLKKLWLSNRSAFKITMYCRSVICFKRELKKSTSDLCKVEVTFDQNEPIRDFIGTFCVDFTTCYLLEPFKYCCRHIRNRDKTACYTATSCVSANNISREKSNLTVTITHFGPLVIAGPF